MNKEKMGLIKGKQQDGRFKTNNHSKLNIPIKKQTVKLNTKARYNSIGCLPENQIKYEKK